MCLDHRDPAHLASQVLRLLDIHDSHHKPAENLWEHGILIDLHSVLETLGTFKDPNPSRGLHVTGPSMWLVCTV